MRFGWFSWLRCRAPGFNSSTEYPGSSATLAQWFSASLQTNPQQRAHLLHLQQDVQLKVAHHQHQHHHHPVEGCPAEGEEEGVCTATCNEWPYSQCRVELRRPDGSWQANTKIQKYTIIHNQKLAGSNVPQSLYGQTRSFQSFPPEVHKLPRVSLMLVKQQIL